MFFSSICAARAHVYHIYHFSLFTAHKAAFIHVDVPAALSALQVQWRLIFKAPPKPPPPTIHLSAQHLVSQIMSWAVEHDPPLPRARHFKALKGTSSTNTQTAASLFMCYVHRSRVCMNSARERDDQAAGMMRWAFPLHSPRFYNTVVFNHE